MKRKFFSVLFALVLVCSLSLVMAVPVAADTVGPTLDSITWVDVDGSKDISATDTLAFTFSEAMDPTTIDNLGGAADADAVLDSSAASDDYGTGGASAVVWSAGDTVVTITLGAGCTVADADTVDPTDVVKDVAGNIDATVSPGPAIDGVMPTLTGIAWTDADGSTDISGGDTLAFTFSEAMDSTTVTAANINTVLATSGVHGYGTVNSGLMLAWDGADEVLTVTLANDFDLVSGETVNPTVAVTDAAANPDNTAIPGQAITDDVGPTLNSITWTDVDASTGISVGDTLAFTFSEAMDPTTIDNLGGAADADAVLDSSAASDDYGIAGVGGADEVVWSAGDTVVTITLGAGCTVADADTVDPTDVVKDVAGNIDATVGPGPAIDGAMPTLDTITWTDADGSTDISSGDTLAFTFSETMDSRTITAANVDTALPITGTGTTYGTTATAVWIPDDTGLTVTLGTGVDIVSGDTVDPADTVTDVVGHADATAAGLEIIDNVGPTLNTITWTDTDASDDISGTDTLAFTFSEAMDTSTVTTGNINAVLATSGVHSFDYGTVTNGLALSWSADGTVLTVTVGSDVEAAGGETVVPDDLVTDVAGNADATAAGVSMGYDEVWVDDGYTVAGYNDGHVWDIDAFDTIEEGIAAVATGGTVNVAPGLYEPTSSLTIAADGLTLQSTGTAEETIIDVTGAAIVAITISGDNVTVDDFAIATDGGMMGISIHGGDAIVRSNVITIAGAEAVGIGSRIGATNTTITENTVVNATIYLEGVGNTVSGNSGGTINISTTSSNNVISGNTLTGIDRRAIVFNPELGTHDNNRIEGNTLSSNLEYGIHVEEDGDGTIVTNLTITGNTITDNGIAGILIDAGVVWGVGNTINNNTISGNVVYGIDNKGTEIIDAENNWWGDVTGPNNATTNSAATGDVVSDYVDYRPWLLAPYAEPVAPVTTISLESGWNFVSWPLIPDDPTTEVVLVSLAPLTTNVNVVWGNYDPVAGTWDSYIPGIGGTLIAMDDGVGFWIQMLNPGTITIVGQEQPDPPDPLRVYPVVGGDGGYWNVIAFKSTTAKSPDVYLAGIANQYTIIYGFDNGAYFIVQEGDNLEPGLAYWIAVQESGNIFP